MGRRSLLLMGLSGCLVQDPAWEPPASTDGAEDGTSTSSAETSGDGSEGNDSRGSSPTDDLPADCSPLGEVPRDPIVVGPDDNATLHTIVAEAPSGTTIALEPGTYDRAGQPTIVLGTSGLTLRSTTRTPEDVILDGGGAGTSPLVTVTADDVTLAELTVQNNGDVLVDVGTQASVLQRPRLYRMVFRDARGALLDVGDAEGRWTDDGAVACSTFEISDAFRESSSSCSGLGAIRISGGARWIVRDNHIEGMWCSTSTYAAIAAALGSSDTRVERNVLRNVYRGILLGGDNITDGRPEPDGDRCGVPDGATWGHVRGVVANNVIWVDDPRMAGALVGADTDLDSMIGFWHVCAGAAVHNTSYVTLTTFNGIEWRYPDTSVTIANNLISTTLMQRQDGVALGLETNGVQTAPTEYVNPGAGDFSLVAGSVARDAGVDVPGIPVPRDFDGEPRVGRPDLGAFEFQP